MKWCKTLCIFFVLTSDHYISSSTVPIASFPPALVNFYNVCFNSADYFYLCFCFTCIVARSQVVHEVLPNINLDLSLPCLGSSSAFQCLNLSDLFVSVFMLPFCLEDVQFALAQFKYDFVSYFKTGATFCAMFKRQTRSLRSSVLGLMAGKR